MKLSHPVYPVSDRYTANEETDPLCFTCGLSRLSHAVDSEQFRTHVLISESPAQAWFQCWAHGRDSVNWSPTVPLFLKNGLQLLLIMKIMVCIASGLIFEISFPFEMFRSISISFLPVAVVIGLPPIPSTSACAHGRFFRRITEWMFAYAILCF